MFSQCERAFKMSLKVQLFRETMRSYGVTRLSLIDTPREDVRIRGTEPCSLRVTTVNKYDSLGGDVYIVFVVEELFCALKVFDVMKLYLGSSKDQRK